MSANHRSKNQINPVILFFKKYVLACQLLIVNGFVLLIRGYQHFISPLIGPKCRFTPSCSHYAIVALKRFGLIKGCWLIVKRVLKCHPLHQGGEDPVPPKTKNNREKN